MRSLIHHLLGRTRATVLGQLLPYPERALHVRELARLTGASAGSLHRELRGLAALGLLLRAEIGRQVHYRANVGHPLHAELVQLLRRTTGVTEMIGEALQPLGRRVEVAFVFGSTASATERAGSDIDLMVLGRASFADLSRALAPLESVLRREINSTLMTRGEFADRLARDEGFARGVMRGAKLWVMGDPGDLAQSAGDRSTESPRGQRRRNTPLASRDPAEPDRRRRSGGQ